MLREALVVYFIWLLGLTVICFIGYQFQLPWVLILGAIACLVVPADKARVKLIKHNSKVLPTKLAWRIVLIMLITPTLFGLWYAMQVKLEEGQYRANIIVIWMLFFCLFPLCIYYNWFFNKSLWEKHHFKVAGK